MDSKGPDLPENLVSGLVKLTKALAAHDINYALIGGLAAGYHSRPRFTRDIDLVLSIPQMVLPPLLGELSSEGFGFVQEETIRQWIQDHMTSIRYNDVQIDWLKPVLPLYQTVIDTAREHVWMDTAVRVAAPEGLILTKLVAFRRQDQLDIEDLLAANRGLLDVDSIRRQWADLTDDKSRMCDFDQMVQRFYYQ